MPGGIGPLELGIVLVIILVVFGPKRLPGLGKSLGSGMREFKESVTGKSGDHDDDDEAGDRPALTRAAGDTDAFGNESTAAAPAPATAPVTPRADADAESTETEPVTRPGA